MRPILKKLRYIVLFLASMLLFQGMTAATSLVSNDKNWLGGNATFNTTEGNDFWLTFMNNSMFDALSQDNKNIRFDMKIALSAREAMTVNVAIGNDVQTVSIGANQTVIYDVDRNAYAQTVYLLTSEQKGYKGVHVSGHYTKSE